MMAHSVLSHDKIYSKVHLNICNRREKDIFTGKNSGGITPQLNMSFLVVC